MAFKEKIPLWMENGCVMDSDIPNLPTGDTTTITAWTAKEFTNSSFGGSGFSNTKGRLVFIPIQPVASASATTSIHCFFVYEGTFRGTIGGFGQTEHIVTLNDLSPKDSFVQVSGVQITCGIDDQGFAVYGCPIECEKSNFIKFHSVNTDSSSAQSERAFKVVISGQALLDNKDFGLGVLFPNE